MFEMCSVLLLGMWISATGVSESRLGAVELSWTLVKVSLLVMNMRSPPPLF
jgi:hypothetical protein